MRQRLFLAGCLLLILAGCQGKSVPPTQLASLTPGAPSATQPAPEQIPTAAQTIVPSSPTPTPQPQMVALPDFGRGVIEDIAWASDGQTLSIATSHGISIQDGHNLAVVSNILIPQQAAATLFFGAGPDAIHFDREEYDQGQYVLGTWSNEGGKLIDQVTIKEGGISSRSPGPDQVLAVSPDGGTIVILSRYQRYTIEADGRIELWNLQTGQLERRLHEDYPNQTFTAAVFSPDGRWLATGCSDNVIYLWDLRGAGDPLHLAGHASGIRHLAFSPDSSTLFSTSDDASLRVWSIPNGTQVRVVRGFKEAVDQVAVSPDGRWIAASDTLGELKLWELHANQPSGEPRVIPDGGRDYQKLVFSPKGDRLAVSVDGYLRLWDLGSSQWISEDLEYGDLWSGLAWSPDGKILYSTQGGRVLVWDAVTGALVKVVGGFHPNTAQLTSSPDGALLAAAIPYPTVWKDSIVTVWETANWKKIATIHSEGAWENRPVFSLDGKYLAFRDADRIGVWDARSGQQIQSIDSDGNALGFTRDGNLVTITRHWNAGTLATGEIRVWDIASGSTIRAVTIDTRIDYPIAFSPQTSLVAFIGYKKDVLADGSYQEIEVWDLVSSKLVYHHEVGYVFQFSPDGALLAIKEKDLISLISTASWEALTNGASPASPFQYPELVFRPDGKMLAFEGDSLARWDISGVSSAAQTEKSRPTPMQTNPPTTTPLPTSTPLPMVDITSIPLPTQAPDAIRVENADRLALVDQLGRGSADRLAWSPDWKTIAIAGSLGVGLYDANSLIERSQISPGKPIRNLAFSPDGKTLATGDALDGEIGIWDVSSEKKLRTMSGDPGGVDILQFSPEGQHLLLRLDLKGQWPLTTVDIDSGANGPTFSGELGDTCAFSPDGKFVLCGANGNTARIWDSRSGEVVFTLPSRTSAVTSVSWATDGRTVAVAYQEAVVQIWDVTQPNAARLNQTLQAGEVDMKQFWPDYLYPMATFSPDSSMLASVSKDNQVRLWDTSNGKLLSLAEGGAISPVFAPDGKQLAAISNANEIHVWQIGSNGSLTLALSSSDHAGPVNSTDFSLDNDELISSDGNSFRAWHLGASAPGVQVLVNFKGDRQTIGSASAFNPVRNQLIDGLLGGAVQIWDAVSGKQVNEVQASIDGFGLNGSPEVTYTKVSPDGKWLVSIGVITDLRIWNTETWEQLSSYFNFGSSDAVFSPDSHLLATSQNQYSDHPGTVEVVDFLNSKSLRSIPGGGPLAFSADGHSLFVARKMVDLHTGDTVREFTSSTETQLKTVAVSPGGDLLVIGRGDGVIELWDIAQGRLVDTLQSGTQAISTLTFSRDGRYLAVGNADGTIWVWGKTGK
jgi:WD40 repeat protein